jgi:transposase
MVASDAQTAVGFSLSTGKAHDAPQGRELLSKVTSLCGNTHLIMDRAYEGSPTRELAVQLGFKPVVPPKKNRKDPWEYDKQLYKRRNEIERLFRTLKRFRRIFTRYDKLDLMFVAFVTFALIIKSCTCVNTT